MLIANLIHCQPDTTRVIGEADIFEIQDRVIDDIVESSREQQAIERAPKRLDPVQQTVITALRGYLNNPDVSRQEIRALMKFLGQPLPNVHVKALRRAYDAYTSGGSIQSLMEGIGTIRASTGPPDEEAEEPGGPINREDLHLICFDYVWS